MATYSVILAAAGRSSRFNDANYKKPFAILKQKAVWLHSAELFLKRDDVKQLIVVISAEDQEDFAAKFGANLAVMGIELAIGGAERADSVQNALAKVKADIDYVAIHDAARPCIDDELVERVFQAAQKSRAAIPTVPVTSTLKRSANGQQVDETVNRSQLYAAQTPQVFDRQLILDLYQKRGEFAPTDESQLAEQAGCQVAMVKGSPFNIKITTKQDLKFATACLAAKPAPRFDAPLHPFADDHLWR